MNRYDGFRTEVLRWDSVDSFTNGDFQDGVHVVSLESSPDLNIAIGGSPIERNLKVLPIFFSAAVVGRAGKSGPFFSGQAISQRLEVPWIAISDPTLDLNGGIDIGWYTGAANTDAQSQIELILTAIARKSRSELLLIGGSGGGFSALHFADKLGDRATAFVWNPQTAILAYAPHAVKAYLEASLGPGAREAFERGQIEDVKADLTNGGIRATLTDPDYTGPRRLFFLQNSTDWHVREHAAPFIKSQGFEHRGRGLYSNDKGYAVLLSRFGDGHAVPPTPLIEAIIRKLLDPSRSARSVYNEIASEGLIATKDLKKLPRDLRAEPVDIANTTDLSIRQVDGLTTATLITKGFSLGEGGVTVNFRFWAHDGSPISHKIEPVGTAVSASPASRVKATISDGFGNRLGELSSKAQTPRGIDENKNIFVYGSCVSRDAFEFPHDFNLVSYVARSPLGSSFSQRVSSLQDLDLSPNSSAFQRRMVETDLKKLLGPKLAASDFDILLIDLIDERLSLLQSDGGIATRSPELLACGMKDERGKILRSTSEEHYRAFVAGWDNLLKVVHPSRIVVSKAYWAQGVDEFHEATQDANRHLDRLYKHIFKSGAVKAIEYPVETLRTDQFHRWGPSPFHYVSDFYRHTLDSLRVQAKVR